MVKVIYLEVDEEITSVIDKIKKVENKEISLFFPKRASLIKSTVNLKLLKRQADFLDKKIVIVTSDETGASLAERSGFKVKKSLDNENKDLKRVNFDEEKKDKSELNIKKFLIDNSSENKKEDDGNVAINDDQEQISSNKSLAVDPANKNNTKKKKKLRRNRASKIVLLPSFGVKSFLVFCLVSFIIVGIIFFVVLPKAEVSVVPKTEPFSSEVEMSTVGSIESINYEDKFIPGELISAEVSSEKEEFESTGERDIGKKAKGKIVLYNNYSSNPQILVASTRLQSQGMVFYSASEVTIPGASIEGGKKVPGRAEILVEAEASGEDYNLGPSNFIIPGLAPSVQSDIYGKSEQSFSGGTSEKVKIVSEEDLSKAKEKLLKNASERGVSDLRDKVTKDDMFIENTIKEEILEVKTNGDIEKEMDYFEMELRASILAMQFSKEDLKNILFYELNADIPQEKFFVNEDLDSGLSYENINFDFEHSKLDFRVKVDKLVAWDLDKKLIKRSIKGKTSEEVKKYMLENTTARDVSVSFWPFWVKRVPQIEKKIEIILDTS